jgi:predicted DNA-binding ribbon-helix-helix protein
MADDQDTFMVSGRRGRPRGTVPGSAVTTWVPTEFHDKLSEIARRHDVSVSSLVRKVLSQALYKKPVR